MCEKKSYVQKYREKHGRRQVNLDLSQDAVTSLEYLTTKTGKPKHTVVEEALNRLVYLAKATDENWKNRHPEYDTFDNVLVDYNEINMEDANKRQIIERVNQRVISGMNLIDAIKHVAAEDGNKASYVLKAYLRHAESSLIRCEKMPQN